jgi:hypothetical protein
MTVLNTGSTKQYSANWEGIFGKGKAKKAAPAAKKKAGKKKPAAKRK